MIYGFVTYQNAEEAFKVIENSKKNPVTRPYDISFGGRRKFCKTVYMDLGKCTSVTNNDDPEGNTIQLQFNCLPATDGRAEVEKPSAARDDNKESFEDLLRQVKSHLGR